MNRIKGAAPAREMGNAVGSDPVAAPHQPRVISPPGVRVRDVMTRSLTCVRPDTPFQEILDVMLGRAVSGVPVVDESGRLLGVVTQVDLLACDAASGAGRCAADLMTPRVMTARPDDAIAEVGERMLATGRKRLLVVEDGGLVGIVARRDLLRCVHRPTAEDLLGSGTRGEVTQAFKLILAEPTAWHEHRETHFWG